MFFKLRNGLCKTEGLFGVLFNRVVWKREEVLVEGDWMGIIRYLRMRKEF